MAPAVLDVGPQHGSPPKGPELYGRGLIQCCGIKSKIGIGVNVLFIVDDKSKGTLKYTEKKRSKNAESQKDWAVTF